MLALGDPVYERPDASSGPGPLPDHGLLVNAVAPGSNAAARGLKAGDVLLAYNGTALKKKDDFKVVADGAGPIVVEVWSDGRSYRRNLAPGDLGVVIDPRPAPEAIAASHAMNRALVAVRSGDRDFAPLPGTRYEVETIAELFRPTIARPGPCSGPRPASPSWIAWPPRARWHAPASSTWRLTGSSTRASRFVRP